MNMNKLAWIAAAAVIAASPASAATFIMQLDGGGSNVGGSSDGNVRTYTSGALTLTATGWTTNFSTNPDQLLASYLGAYSGGGLGVTNPGEDGNNGTHQVDNDGREDFILLKFNAAVDLTSMYLNVFDMGFNPDDSDATVFYKNGATAPTNGGNSPTYFGQFSSISVAGGPSDGARTVDVGGHYSDTWLVAAATGTQGNGNDAFKLYSITVNTPTGGVPEPASWALMIMGIGGIGAAARSRRKAVFA